MASLLQLSKWEYRIVRPRTIHVADDEWRFFEELAKKYSERVGKKITVSQALMLFCRGIEASQLLVKKRDDKDDIKQ